MTGPTKLSWRGKLLLSVLSPLVVFGLLEAALRIGGFRYEPWRAHLAGKTYDELKQRELYAPHPDLIWTLRPSTILNDSNLGFFDARTNSHGLRGPELPTTKGPDELQFPGGRLTIEARSPKDEPLDADVRVDGWSFEAEEGPIVISGVPAGEHTVIVFARGHLPTVRRVVVTEGESLEVVIRMPPRLK